MDTSSTSKVSKANTSFLLALFKKLSEDDQTGNIFFSPFSISSALAMVMLGTAGNTAKQISEVLCFTDVEQPKPEEAQLSQKQSPIQSQLQTQQKMTKQLKCISRLPNYLREQLKCIDGENDVNSSFEKLLNELNKDNKSYDLSTANRLYGEQTFEFKEKYLADSKNYYKAELEPVDFIKAFDAARIQINGWVEEQTKGKIKDLLAEGSLDDTTVLVLVNAIYFKGLWNNKFEKESTVDAEFRINKTDTKPVKMMRHSAEFNLTFIPELGFQILEMPYKGEELSMLIFLPKEIEDETTGLEKLESELTYEKFTEWTNSDKMRKMEVAVSLPRFKLEETYDLKTILISMGLADAFNVGMSDFSGMSTANNLVLSKVVHKSFVEVNEEGTEAAAATAAVITNRSLPPRFTADQPFLFFIQHKPTNTVLFAGRYSSPE